MSRTARHQHPHKHQRTIARKPFIAPKPGTNELEQV